MRYFLLSHFIRVRGLKSRRMYSGLVHGVSGLKSINRLRMVYQTDVALCMECMN